MVKDLLDQTLDPIGIPYYYFERPVDIYPCIVITYNEYTNTSGDNTEESRKYDIYLNLITKDQIRVHSEAVKAAMAAKFSKVIVNSPVKLDGTDYYQITMNYEISLSN